MPQWQEKQNCSRDVWKGKSRQYDHGPSADFKFPMNEWPNLAIQQISFIRDHELRKVMLFLSVNFGV